MKNLKSSLVLVSFFVGVISCGARRESDGEGDAGAVVAEEGARAISVLRERGYSVSSVDGGTVVCCSPDTGGQGVTVEDIAAINALRDVVEFRVVAFAGIAPAVFAQLRVFPRVKRVVIHYGMPAETLRDFDKFPNVEVLKFWGHPVSCEHLPPLERLRVFHHEATEGEVSLEAAERIAACRSLEEVEIQQRVSEDGVAILRGLPLLKSLVVNQER